MTSSRLGIIGSLVLAPLCAGELLRFEAVEPHMGTLVRIQLYAAHEAEASAAFRAAFARIAQLDDVLSDYKPESELNRVARAGGPARVSAELFTVLAASQKLAEETDGAFDVTLGPVVRLWREARRTSKVPDAAGLREAASRCGFRKLHLDAATRTVTIEAGIQLDLGGIAKGYAADEALSTLGRLGIRRALVAMSGDLAFGDPPPGKRGWRIDAGGHVLELRNAAVSTSGDDEQHLDANGIRYSHIIDPRTLAGLSTPIRVTVVARRGIDADSLATAVSVLGADRGIALIERWRDAAAIVITANGSRESSRWSEPQPKPDL